MSRRKTYRRYGLAEVPWIVSESRKLRKAKRQPARAVIPVKAKQGTPTCAQHACPENGLAPALLGRVVCAVCADRLDAKAAEHRERQGRRDAES